MTLPLKKHPGLPIDSPERRRLPPILRRAWYSLNQAFRRHIAHTGVTPDQFTVLRCVLESGPSGMTQSELSATMASDPNTIAALVERMELNKLITRIPHDMDRRAHRIQITRDGEAKYAEVRKLAVELQKDVLKVLPENEREPFLEQLAKVADACRGSAEKAARHSRRSRAQAKKPIKASIH